MFLNRTCQSLCTEKYLDGTKIYHYLAVFVVTGIIGNFELELSNVPNDLTSDSPLKEAVLGFFDLAEIVARGSKNKKNIWVLCKIFR
jgi:uncharacterized lipoprotein NlpE involved in copper resistance